MTKEKIEKGNELMKAIGESADYVKKMEFWIEESKKKDKKVLLRSQEDIYLSLEIPATNAVSLIEQAMDAEKAHLEQLQREFDEL